MKIFTGIQIKELDQYRIEHEPVASIDLMERAARAITRAICERWTNHTPFIVFAGPGNNGGDALAVARLLAEEGYRVEAFLFNVSGSLSDDCAKNRQRLVESKRLKGFTEVTIDFDPPQLTAETVEQAVGRRICLVGEVYQSVGGQGGEHRRTFRSDDRRQYP